MIWLLAIALALLTAGVLAPRSAKPQRAVTDS